MALQIFTSNRIERLVEALAKVVRTPLGDPFDQEIIVVQSRGMERWLSLELARLNGIFSNTDFPFPNLMVQSLFSTVLSEVPETSPFSPDSLSWRIASVLPDYLDQEAFAILHSYLADDKKGLKLYQLSCRIADTFDQYTIFRRDLIQAWEGGAEPEEWQAVLWRALSDIGAHRGKVSDLFQQTLASGTCLGTLPERISIFGVSYIPAYHLDLFKVVARHTAVNMFLLSPTSEYWADILPERKIQRLPKCAQEHAETGNPLLASLGKLGKDFSLQVLEAESEASGEDLYLEQMAGTVLENIQSDILNLRATLEEDPVNLPDSSIQFHSCHTPLREVEVLHDHLLHFLETLPNLAPRDILIMTPDIETYAPYISAVFGACRDDRRRIPFAIADRSMAATGLVSRGLLALLGLPSGRLTAAAVLDILNIEPVRLHFGLSVEEIETISHWVTETNICWGIDSEHRASFDLPPYGDNSWEQGLKRLLLGYAMPDEGALFQDILPYDHIEGSLSGTLGKFLTFSDALFRTVKGLNQKRSLGAWSELLASILEQFFKGDDDCAREIAAIRDIMVKLRNLEADPGYKETVSLEVIRAWLSERISAEGKNQSFLTGGITFCSLLPMRSLPFRVIALIGMNDGAFPRQNRAPGFDRIAANPRRGDRSLREEDRYLFLETLLSAREVLWISYVGQSMRDNSEIPPSVVVSELLDLLTRRFPKVPAKQLVLSHRLQPFSTAYFTGDDERLFSFSTENCVAAATEKGAREGKPLISSPIIWKQPGLVEVKVEQLLRFFSHPAKYFMRTRLGVRLPEVNGALSDRESFELDNLEDYNLKQEILQGILAGKVPGDILILLKAQGELPPGEHGEVLFHRVHNEVKTFSEQITAITQGVEKQPLLDVDLVCGAYRLEGTLDGIWGDNLIRYRCAKIKPKDRLSGWLEHLILHAVCQGSERSTRIIMTDKQCTYRPCSDANEHLQAILEEYRRGMELPLKFFPNTSYAYVEKKNMEQARKTWNGDDYNSGENADPWFDSCFGRCDPLDGEFVATAEAVLGPMQLYREGK